MILFFSLKVHFCFLSFIFCFLFVFYFLFSVVLFLSFNPLFPLGGGQPSDKGWVVVKKGEEEELIPVHYSQRSESGEWVLGCFFFFISSNDKILYYIYL